MTLRAFLIGLLAVIGLSILVPYNFFVRGNTPLADYQLPVGAFFAFVLITIGLNVLIKLVRRGWALQRAELMLIWCMLIAAAGVQESGLMRYTFTWVGAPAYYANRPEYKWDESFLSKIPDPLVLSKDKASEEVRQLFEGPVFDEPPKVPWRAWARPLATWGVYMFFFWLANFFMFAMLRKQWVEHERLSFPLVRIPLELAAGSEEPQLLPAIMHRKVFWLGAAVAFVVMTIQVLPVILNLGGPVEFLVPFQDIFKDTPLAHADLHRAKMHVVLLGIGFILPSEISFSFWMCWVLMRCRFLFDYWLGYETGGDWGQYYAWHEAGVYCVLTVALIFMARRHLWHLIRVGLFLSKPDDRDEPVNYRVSFWGMIISIAAMIVWSWYFKLNPLVALILLAMNLGVLLVLARVVAQGGFIANIKEFHSMIVLNGLGGGHAFTAAGAIIVWMQDVMMMYGLRGGLFAHATNSFKAAEAIERRRKLLLPAMLFAMLVAAGIAGYSVLNIFYSKGALNAANTWGAIFVPKTYYAQLHRVITEPELSAQPQVAAIMLGGATMWALMFVRTQFYWWPLHWIGLVTANNGFMAGFWLSFLVGWLTKTLIMKFGSGRLLRQCHTAAYGMLIAAFFLIGVVAMIALVTDLKIGAVFLPI